jgi:BexC/CtrB/KpsE family polysaccharide export inner-membrane protein
MTETRLNYLGPITRALEDHATGQKAWWRRIPLAFVIVVIVPTLLAAIYFGLVASPQYVSEARFIVRSANEGQPSSLGIALEGVGLSNTTSDAFAVHEYMQSRDAFQELRRRFDLRQVLNGNADLFSRYPRPWEGRSEEEFYKGFQRFITVGYDSATGISTLRVQTFKANDSRALAQELLKGGEALVNRLNDRATTDAVREAMVARDRARARLAESQASLTAFRNREAFIDPALTAQESSGLIGNLLTSLAQVRAQRSEIAAAAPASPQLPVLDGRIAAYERQIAAERAKIAGNAGSLAPKVSVYQDLQLDRELADRELVAATSALTTAEQEARRQRLYLDQIVSPSLPDAPTKPDRFLAFLTVLMSSLVVYGIGWFIWAGAREHGQG